MAYDHGGVIHLEPRLAPPVDLRVVPDYKHLGSLLVGCGGIGPEVVARRTAAGVERRSLTGYFRQSGEEASTNVCTAQAVGTGVLLYSAAIWGPSALAR